ncbi:universal stress protein [Bosea vestrisii]|uniref:universal stress protein n=1 Tax=Bosea vestrisii TaxID=151416 RepID=UPI003266CB40
MIDRKDGGPPSRENRVVGASRDDATLFPSGIVLRHSVKASVPIVRPCLAGRATPEEDAMYKSILVPVDLAEAELAAPAIAAAESFATASDGTIRLVFVRSLVPITYMEFVPADFDAGQQSESEAKLAEIAAKVNLPAERVSAKVLVGSVHGEVLAEADASGADLIVIGSHEPGILAYVIGSNASTIVRRAKCSVLVVR